MTADLQHYYGLSLRQAGQLPATSVGALIRFLPGDSNLQKRLDPNASLTYSDLAVRQLEFDVRVFMAAFSGKRGIASREKPLPLPGDMQPKLKPTVDVVKLQEQRVAQKLGINPK